MQGHCQRIVLDMPTKAGVLTLFPEVGKENNYYYVSDKARLAVGEDGRPKFSFLRYVTNTKGEGGALTIEEGEGGGILHAVVSLGVTDEEREEAERQLKQINPEALLVGPVIFQSGTFGLVTSFTDENGELSKKVAGIGNAPILDGQQAAVSIHLTKLGATLLWESFETATPDISFSFLMTMDGYRLPKEALIEANFEDLYNSTEWGVKAGIGGTVSGMATGDGQTRAQGEMPIFFGADIKSTFEELRKEGAIKITQIGSDEGMDALITTAYTKLADMMFERIDAAANSNASPQQLLSGLTSSANGESDRAGSPMTGATFSFKMREKKRTGTFRLDLNKWTSDELVMRFDENIGNLSQYKGDERHFKQINTDDRLFRQRSIYPILDGYNAADFGEYINFVTVRLRKDHGEGNVTERDVKIDRQNFNQPGNAFALVYGWNEDENPDDWMSYEYEVLWSFFGGVTHREPFRASTFSAINLAAPYRKKVIEFQAEKSLLEEQEIRMVTVDVFYQVGDLEFSRQVVLNPSRDLLSQQTEYLTGQEDDGYEYEITWRLKGNRTLQSERRASTDGLMFVDELPEDAEE